jgi:hypothetical protein
MTQEEIIEMARQTGWHDALLDVSFVLPTLTDFAKLVAAKQREKSLKLFMLLDDVDAADDIAKADDALYRSLCRQAHKKRWDVLTSDDNVLHYMLCDALKRWDVLTGDDVDNAIRARGEQA